jgi:hypothetical protein
MSTISETSPEMLALCDSATALRLALTAALASGDLHYHLHPLDLLDLRASLYAALDSVPRIQDTIPTPAK